MKTIKWSSIALFSLCMFAACTKSADTLSEQSLTSGARFTGAGGSANTGNTDVDPGLVVTFNPETATEGQQVTVTATFSGETATPTCGKLFLEEYVDGDWTNRGSVDVDASHQEVNYAFTPTIVGDDVYRFRAHYVAQNCQGFNENKSGDYFLDVLPACQGLSITGNVDEAENQGNGIYQFTVSYHVTACGIEYDHLKTQGGLTAFTDDVTLLTPGGEKWNVGKSDHPNTIAKWEEDASIGSGKTYTVQFTKAWSGTGTIELTGEWSVKATLNGVETGVASFDKIYYSE